MSQHSKLCIFRAWLRLRTFYFKGEIEMKFCAKCGAQMPDEAETCPQCNFPVFDPSDVTPTKAKTPKKKINNLFIVVPLTIVVSAITSFIVASSVLPKAAPDKVIENSPVYEETNSTNEDNTFTSETTESVCPAQEYGNHSWSSANCTTPSHCYYCNAYKDEKLGYHEFYYDEDIDEIVCVWCHMFKDDT